MNAAAPALSKPFLGLTVEQRYRRVYKPVVFTASLLPLAWIACHLFGWLGVTPAVDPVKFLELEFGQTTLNFILITLLITPVRRLADLPHLPRLRRMLGLFAFFYVVLHFSVYVALDLDFNWHMVGADIVKRPYITVGFTALLLLIPLAVTSTRRMMRRLGGRWTVLHRLIYVIAILGVWHYYWQEKRDVHEPLLYAGILALLLGYRLAYAWRKRIVRVRARSGGAVTVQTEAPAPWRRAPGQAGYQEP